MDEYGWASAVGHIRIKEKELMSRADLLRIAEAQDLDRALAALRDTPYGPHVSALKEQAEFDDALVSALSEAYRYVFQISPEPVIIAAYRARNDFHNLKVLAKSAYLGTSLGTEALSFMGNFDPGEYSGGVALETLSLDVPLGPAQSASLIKTLLGTYMDAVALVDAEKGSSSEGLLALKVDSLVDRRYYAWFAGVFRRLGYPGMSEFQKSEVDLLNLRMSIRALRMGLRSAIFGDIVLPGGTIPTDAFVRAYESGLRAIPSIFKDTPWMELAEAGVSFAERRESLTKWEKACDDALMRVAKKARYYSLGPEPVFGYLYGKETEVRNLRVILAGKQSLLPSQEISERLREPYV